LKQKLYNVSNHPLKHFYNQKIVWNTSLKVSFVTHLPVYG